MSMLNMTQVPEIIGEILNINTEVAGILVTLVILGAMVVFLAIIDAKEIAMAGLTVGGMAFFTFIGWFNPWITVLVALVVAVLFGSEATRMITGGGTNKK